MDDYKGFGYDILCKASAIQGVDVPASSALLEIIGDEVEKMVSESSFASLGYEEILLAIRLNAWHNFDLPASLDVERIKFFGAFVSPDFLSRVLKNYVTIRNFLDRKLQNFIDGF